jgi:GMP synthase-like glutamine amidotransferase
VGADPLDGASPVVVREYQADAPAGLIGEWLDARGIPWRVSRPSDEPAVAHARSEDAGIADAGIADAGIADSGIADAGAIVALGSSASAYWGEPAWIAEECDLLARRVAAGVPVLGICFGAQALARALGGEVARAPRPEIGWVRPTSDRPELTGPYLAWHFDAITLPPGATPLAATPDALQAFTRGRAMGLQFHPEVTPGIWRDWAEDDPAALTRHVTDPAALAAEIATTATATRERTFRLLDWWRAWLTAEA